MCADGTAYSDNGDGLLRLDVVHSTRHDRWGFGVFAAAAGEMVPSDADEMGRRSPSADANFEFISASTAIGDAVALAPRRVPPPHPVVFASRIFSRSPGPRPRPP